MNILLPDMHKNYSRSMCYVLGELLGHTVYLLDDSWNNIIKYGDKWTEDKILKYNLKNTKTISFHNLEASAIDIVICPCVEQINDIIQHIYNPYRNKYKYISYYGNEYYVNAIPWNIFQNHLSADTNSHVDAVKNRVNSIEYLPPIKYEDYSFSFSNSNKINTYIHYYQYSWKHGYSIYNSVKQIFVGLEFTHYGKHGDKEIDELDMPFIIKDSTATCHFKDREGYGMAVIESMASGRPIIGFKPNIESKKLSRWVNDSNSILFSSYEECIDMIGRYVSNQDYRYMLQAKCAKDIKQIIDPGEQAFKLNKFLNELR
jgi:glycosyltransferase involved in cell wall biosynthesis